MELLKDLYEKSNIQYSKDMTDAVPADMMKDIQKNIRDGASNTKLKWANALELVHKAYKVANVQRPFPSMKNAFKQYEQNIQYAVQQLATHHGMDADWRMSSSVFREAANLKPFRVSVINEGESKSFLIEATHPDKVTSKIVKEVLNAYDVRQKEEDGRIVLQPRKFGIKQPFSITIQPL